VLLQLKGWSLPSQNTFNLNTVSDKNMTDGVTTGSAIIKLVARDGHRLEAYVARPRDTTRGGVVVAQEMYGLNNYLRSVCDFYAAHGYLAIAPALYDRQERGLVFAYDKQDHDRAQHLYKNWNLKNALGDLAAARDAVATAGNVGLVGFCWGGSLAWLAACRRDYACAVAYYGSMMPDFAGEQPRCPVIAHIGDHDNTLPPERIDAFRASQPSVPVHIYAGAQHGFDNEHRHPRYDAEACRTARERTLAFFARHIG
jgi:carboxymethylenebutenolidase